MNLTAVTNLRDADPATEPRFVCPLCGTVYPSSRESCVQCGGTHVVSVTNAEVYETIVPMCGPDSRRNPSREPRVSGPSSDKFSLRDTIQTHLQKVGFAEFTHRFRQKWSVDG